MSNVSNDKRSPSEPARSVRSTHHHGAPLQLAQQGAELPWNQRRYRNRHGRGQRQPMFGLRVPQYRTKAGTFDDLVLSHIRRLKAAWPELFVNLQCAVEDVPPSDPMDWEERTVPLSRSFPSSNGIPARIVLYSMPIQSRALSWADLELLIHDELVYQLAELNGLHPEDIDPDWEA